jgi:hypothetical protein
VRGIVFRSGVGSLLLVAAWTFGLRGQVGLGTGSHTDATGPSPATSSGAGATAHGAGSNASNASGVAAAPLPQAAEPAAAKKEPRAKAAARLPVTPEREAAALTFVQRNHAELAELLAYLKANQPEEYQRAIRDLSRVVERLGGIQERDPLQYELEVALWTAQSRVQLLTARVKMGASDEVLRQLREALGAQMDARLALLHHERSKVAERLSRLDSEIAMRENHREAMIQRQMETLLASSEAQPPAVAKNPSAKNNPAKASSKTVPKTSRKNSPAP